METLWQDLKYGARMLARQPGFTAVAVLTLALGIGANTAIFSVVNAVLFKPLPIRAPEEMIGVYAHTSDTFATHEPMAYPDYEDLRDQSQTLSSLIGYAAVPLALEHGDESEMILGEIVTGNYFTTLGINAQFGRTFLPEEDKAVGAAPLAVLSYATWQRRFGGDPSIIGRTIRLNGNAFTVVGVAPASFLGLTRGFLPELWVPMKMSPVLRSGTTVNTGSATQGLDRLQDRGRRWLFVMGRLKPGVSPEQAGAELQTVATRLQAQYPDTNKERSVLVLPLSQIKIFPDIDSALYATSLVLMGLVALVLLIACANVANMLLARASGRRREIALRLSLGASRARLIRQLLTESLLLALGGGALALLMTAWTNDALNALQFPIPVQIGFGLSLDFRVLGFTLLVAVVTTSLFGLVPALHASRADLVSALKEETGTTTGGHSRRRLGSALVVAQVALSLLLLVFAGLSLRSLLNAHRVDSGFDSRGVVVASFSPELRGYKQPEGELFYRQLLQRVRSLPGVSAAALASQLPLAFDINIDGIVPEENAGTPEKDWPAVDNAAVGPGYFEAMGIPLVQGRDFSENDTAETPGVVVVNQALAERFWPHQNPLGHRIRIEDQPAPYEVVGVARNSKYRTLGEDLRPYVYTSLLQVYYGGQTLIVHAAGNPAPVLLAIRQQARELDDKIPVHDLETLETATSASLLLPRAGAVLFGLFGALALVLASVGLYGLMAYTVSQRTREFGIRMALGAQPRHVVGMVFGHAARLISVGLVLGVLAALPSTQVISVLLYGISPTDPVTLALVALALVLVAGFACWWPARRATRVDPMTALRYQ